MDLICRMAVTFIATNAYNNLLIYGYRNLFIYTTHDCKPQIPTELAHVLKNQTLIEVNIR